MYILKMFHQLSYYNLVMYMSLLNCVDGFNLQQDSSSIREQLVSDFIPIDGCPVGTQLTESPVHVHRSEDKNNKPREMVCNVSTFCLLLTSVCFILLTSLSPTG